MTNNNNPIIYIRILFINNLNYNNVKATRNASNGIYYLCGGSSTEGDTKFTTENVISFRCNSSRNFTTELIALLAGISTIMIL